MQRQGNTKGCAESRARALGLNLTAVRLHNRLAQRETDADATEAACRRPVNLKEAVEDTVELVLPDPDAVVGHGDRLRYRLSGPR